MGFSFRQVRYFIAAAELGQVSHAAVELNVSQSAVTAAIKQLEELLGTRLLVRHASGVSLTLEGARFLPQARAIAAAVAEAMRVSGEAPTVEGRVRVGVSYTIAGYFLPPYLARFRRAYPGVTVELRETHRTAIEDGLVRDELDLAVMLTSNLENTDQLRCETLFRSARRLWLPVDHPLQKAERVSLADVAREPYIMLTVDEAAFTARRYWDRTPHQPNVIFQTSSVEAVRSMVAAGMGVTILSDMVYRPWSLDGQRIDKRALAEEVPTMDAGLAWKRDLVASPAVRAFRDHLGLAFRTPIAAAAP
ncbi:MULTISPECIES: LysR family transcriptional regulator [unclassified Inquilinus]|uniref:LysR family transcriptional regulator n=1 Tax=unclassified Inquilinus TaxID=2645927 RepID=UPI003F91F825